MTNSGMLARTCARLIRVLTIANFSVMLLLIGLGRSHELDLALRRLGLEDVIGRSLQVWFVGATLLATTLFVGVLWKKSRLGPSDTQLRIKTEAILLSAWWLTLLALLAFGYMLGMGG